MMTNIVEGQEELVPQKTITSLTTTSVPPHLLEEININNDQGTSNEEYVYKNDDINIINYFKVIANDFIQSIVSFEFFKIYKPINDKCIVKPIIYECAHQLFESNEIIYHLFVNKETPMLIMIHVKEHQYNFIQHYLEQELQGKCYVRKKHFINILNNLKQLMRQRKNIEMMNNFLKVKYINTSTKNYNYLKKNFISK
jgi:hypothetical protein